ncbi:MAG: heavy metal translocating P-type ATPase metal-binding domain-containing protein [Planctomycetota bacterium]|nr:heavy metal translocating P-type ATPase metal-binding domain-containing protein [Planctomycetota bacterium]
MNAAAIAATKRVEPLRVAERRLCAHCGLPLGTAWCEELGEFCCAGCRTVNALLRAEGLERYYDLRGGSEAPPPELRADTLAWLDPLVAKATPDANGVARMSLDIQGVHCAACVWLLQELWTREKGAVDVRINPALGRAELAWMPAAMDLRGYVRGAERFGYRFGPVRKGDLATSRDLVVRLGICLAAALNVMIFSLCFYLGLAPGEGALYSVLGRWSFALSTVAVLAGGTLFFRSAWLGIRRGVVHLDLPIALGIALSYAGSTWAWLAIGPEAAYFDTVTIFVALMVLGRWLQERVLQKNRHALLASDGVEDLYVRRRRGGELETVSASAIEPGDELWVLPGDLVPVEGRVLQSAATFSLDWITGESRPRQFEPGETVPAGAFQTGDRSARLAACEGFAASRLHTLLSASGAEAARSRRSASAGRSWSRFAFVYVTAVLVLATAGVAAWWSSGPQRAIEVALSVLVVTCPCALGLATPLAHEIVHSALRRRGIFLRESSFLQRVLRLKHVIFDKTGTLTRGTLRLSEGSLRTLDGLSGEARAVLAEATARSLHPVSRSLHAQLARDGRVSLLEGLDVREVPGHGLEARLGGRTWRLGRPAFALAPAEAVEGPVVLSVDGALVAAFELEEDLKSDARSEVERLREQGCEVHLLSGDRPERVERVAASLGIDPSRALGGQEPEDKARYVRALDREDTWMVGDGINDAPAFDAAACAATPAVDRPNLPARADLYYLGDGVSAVRVALVAARDLSRVVRTNLALAIAYNVAAVSACLLGLVGPLAAAVLMPASSLGLIGLTTWRLSRRSARWTS